MRNDQIIDMTFVANLKKKVFLKFLSPVANPIVAILNDSQCPNFAREKLIKGEKGEECIIK